MKTLRRLSIAALFAFGLSNAVAQAPPVVPALPDTPRLTSYMIAGTTCACAVNFALYGNANLADYQDWVEVFLNGVQVAYNDPTYGWTITSPTGALASIARPITDAVLTFTNVQTGTVEIVGAARPARLSQWSENQGVSARNLNVAFTGIVAQLREVWDKINDVSGRDLKSQPGNTVGLLPPPAACSNAFLGFDSTGLNPLCRVGAGTGNVVGPATSTVNHLAAFGNVNGSALLDIALGTHLSISSSTLSTDATGTGVLATKGDIGVALPSLTTSQLYGGTGGAGVAQHFPAGTGVETALQQNTGFAGAPVLFNGAGGKPSSIDLSNGTGTPGSVTPLTSVTATFFARTATAPCDLISGGCASAWSVTRLMRAAYAGYLFQVQRLSDNTTQNIGLNSAGAVDTTTLSNFCFATTCVVKTLYDQVGSNNLAQATLAKMPSLIIGDGQALPYVYTTNTGNYPNNTYLEQTTTSGLPTGAASKTINMVGKIQYSNCCGGFGMTENPAATDYGVSEAGQMFSLVWLNAAANGYWYNGYAGTWAFGVDVEQGYNWGAISPSDGNTYGEIKYNSVGNTITAILNGATVFSGQSPLYTINTGSRLTLGSAGDNTPVQNVFYEGFIASAFTSTANDEAVYQNQLAFYNGGVKSPPSQLVANCGVSACAVLNAYAIGGQPDIAYVLNQALSGGHQWAMEASATGTGSIGGAGGLTFRDVTAAGDRLGIDANGQVIIPNGLRISNIPGPTNTASLTAKNCGTLVEPVGSTAFTLTLPAATAVAGCEYSIWNNDSSAVTLNGGGNNFNGPYGNSGATEILSPLAFVIVQSDGYNWIVLLATNMGFTISNLPSCGGSTKGARLYVTNAQTTPTFLGAAAAIGAVVAPVFCNGSSWVYG
jgi:hypothetical protein